MQDWKVAVLVVIIVAFVVLAALLLFLLYRFGHWRRFTRKTNKTTLRYIDNAEHNVVRNSLEEEAEGGADMYQQLFLFDPRLRPSPHILYFIDFQGELMSLDFKKKPLQHLHTEPDLQRYLADTFHPTIEEGNRVVAVAAEMLGLSYVDDRQALVVLDLARLLNRDADFGARMTHTAERPLLLSRLVADGVDGTVYTTLTRYGYTVGAPPYAAGPSISPWREQQQQQQRQEITVDVAHARANPMSQASSPAAYAAAVPPPALLAPAHAPPSQSVRSPPSPMPATQTASLYTPDAPGLAPVPLIHPCSTHHITTSTPITVTAATYTVLHGNGARSVLDVANAAAIEGARLRWDRRQGLVVPLVSGAFVGYQCVMDPATENGNLLPPRGSGSGGAAASVEPIVCLRANALQYTVERVNSTQWLPVERSFYLPAGRWCVRARSVLYSDDSSKSTAKVFTVNLT